MFEVMTGVIGILHKILYPSILEFQIVYGSENVLLIL